MKRKILFLSPPLFFDPKMFFLKSPEEISPPLPYGILSLASFLEQYNIDSRVVPMHAFLLAHPKMMVLNDGKEGLILSLLTILKQF
jgi:hypothetical protein